MPLPHSWLRGLSAVAILVAGWAALAPADSVAAPAAVMSLPPIPSTRLAPNGPSGAATPMDATDPCLTTPLASVAPPTANINDPELQNLARALRNSPSLIYEYVHDNIATLPQFDSVKGPVGALLDAKGTPVDQAELMALLLRISNYPDAMVEFGQETISLSQVANWLGVDTSQPTLVSQILNAGDFDNNASLNVGTVTLSWAWVKVTINGQVTYFDPATKSYKQNAGLGAATVTAAMGLNTANFIAGAESGTSFSMTPLPLASVTGLNATTVQSQLASMSGSLVSYLRANQPAAATQDIIGGSTVVVPFPVSVSSQTTPFSAQGTSVTDYDPTALSGTAGSLPRVQLRLDLPGNPSVPAVVNTSDVYGHSLYVFFDVHNVSGLWLDNSELVSAGAASGNNSSVKMNFQVCYPTAQKNSGALNWPGTAAGQNLFLLNFRIAQPNLTYALSNLWGPTGRGVLERQRRLLEAARAAAKASGTGPVSGTPYEPLFRSLTTLSLTWGSEFSRVQEIADRAAGTLTVSHTTLGIVGLTPQAGAYTPYFDLPWKAFTPVTLTVQSLPANAVQTPIAVETLDSGMVSILEGTVLEQTQPNMQAASMATLFALAGQPGQSISTTIYDFNDNPSCNKNIHDQQSAWYNGLIPGFGYNAADSYTLSSWILNQTCPITNPTNNINFRVLVPGKGALTLGSYSGSAYWAYGQGFEASQSTATSYNTAALGTYLSGNVDNGTGAAAGSSVAGESVSGNAFPGDPGGGVQNAQIPGDGVAGGGVVPGSSVPGSAGLNTNAIITDAAAPADPSQSVPGAGTLGSSNGRQHGDFQYSHTDLSIGAGGFPYGLSFTSSYDSNNNLESGPLGPGWTDNFSQRALVDTDVLEQLGTNSPVSGASGIVAIYTAFSVIQSGVNWNNYLITPVDHAVIFTMIANWFESQTINHVVSVTGGGTDERFVLLPDGVTFNPPLHSSATLAAAAAPLSYTYTSKTQQKLTFDTLGNALQWSDPDGAQVNFTYNGTHLLTGISTNVGSGGISRTLRLEYNDPNFLNQVTTVCAVSSAQSTATCEAPDVQLPDGEPIRASYAYNPVGQLQFYSDPHGKVTQFNYDPTGRLNQIFYPVLKAKHDQVAATSPDLANYYNSLGLLIAQQDANTNTTNIYVAGSRTEILDAAYDSHVSYYDPRGNLIYDVDGFADTTTYAYDGLSRVISTSLPETNYFTYVYDNSQPAKFLNLLGETDVPKAGSNTSPDTRTRGWTYDAFFNKVISATDFSGNTTLVSIDPTYGTVKNVTLPVPAKGAYPPVYTFQYNALGQVVQETDPPSQANASGRVTQFIYGDSYSDLTSVIVDDVAGGLNLTTQYGYDAGGNQSLVITPNDSIKPSPQPSTSITYDADRHVTTILPPSPGAGLPALPTSFAYDDDGQVQVVTRSSGSQTAANQVTSYVYTPTEKVSTVTDASNDTLTYSYDAVDRLVATTDGQIRVVSASYDPDSRISLVCQGNTAFNGGLPCLGETPVEQRTYWPNGTLKQRLYPTAAKGWQGLLYTPDGYDRPRLINYPDGTFEKTQHNASDDVINHISRGGETVSWTYDGLHRMATKTGLPNLAYSYDQASDLIAVAVTGTNGSNYGGVPQQGIWTFGYDSAERKTSDDPPLGRITYGLDLNGNRTSLTYPDGTVVPRNYDELNRPGLTLGFRATAGVGIITNRFDSFDRTYARLLGNASGWYTNFSYDLADHQVNKTIGGQGLDLTRVFDAEGGGANPAHSDFQYTFDLAHKASGLTTYSGAGIAHPTAANTLAGLTANTSNELLNPVPAQKLSYNADGYLTSDGARSYTYDGDGDGRILGATNGGTNASYGFDVFGRRISKTVNGTTTQFLLDDQGHEIAEYNGAGNVQRYLVYDPFNAAPDIALDTNGNPLSYFEMDRLGSVVATSTGNTLANTYSYLPYGDTPSGTLSGTSFGYAGYRYDYETGTYHTATRQYDPRIGRFLQSDPIGQAGGNNIYAYANGDPVNGADPSGLAPGDGAYRSGQVGGAPDNSSGSQGAAGVGQGGSADPASSSGGGGSLNGGGGSTTTTVSGGSGSLVGPQTETPVNPATPPPALNLNTEGQFFIDVSYSQDQATSQNLSDVNAQTITDAPSGISFSGSATFYDLPGTLRADGQAFDPECMCAATFQKGLNPYDHATLTVTSDDGTSIRVIDNDTGPFLRGANGRAVHPLQADPNTAIDLTRSAFSALTGGNLGIGRIHVTVTAP